MWRVNGGSTMMHSLGWRTSCVAERRRKEVHREVETNDGGWKRWRRQWRGCEKREAWKIIEGIRDRGGATTHRLKAPAWLEEDRSQEGGVRSTEEYGGRTVPKA